MLQKLIHLRDQQRHPLKAKIHKENHKLIILKIFLKKLLNMLNLLDFKKNHPKANSNLLNKIMN
jgi:hypothetical protein